MNNPQAFPQIESRQVGEQGEYHMEIDSYGGMTLRDYFAAKAMQALVGAAGGATGGTSFGIGSPEAKSNNSRYAFVAYIIADAMMEARDA